MASNRNHETLGLLGALLFEKHSDHFSDHPSYEELQQQLNDLVNDLAFDRVSRVLSEHAEYYFQQGEWMDAEPYARDVMTLMGRSDKAYGQAAMIRGYAHIKMGELAGGIEFLKEAIASCAQTRLGAPLEEMKRFISEQIHAQTLHREDFQQLLHLCDSTLETLHSQTSQDEC